MHTHPPSRFLVLIEAAGPMIARLFDARRVHLADFDAASEEVAVMTSGVVPERGASGSEWGTALEGHSAAEREAALVFKLDP
nr:hypothetical protein [uncultured Caldimonas sp.]